MALVITKNVDVVEQHVDTATTPETRFIKHSNEQLTGAIAALAPAQSLTVLTGADTLLSVIEVTVTDVTTAFSIPAPYDCKLVDAWAYKDSNAGGAGDEVAVLSGATTIATISANVAAFARCTGTIDVTHADNAWAEGESIIVDPALGAGTVTCTLFLVLKRTA